MSKLDSAVAGASRSETSPEIREARPQDFARIADLSAQLSYPSSAEHIARRLAGMQDSREHAVFVAVQESGEIAGWLGVFVYRSVEADARAEISGLVVDEKVRSRGIGRQLLVRAEIWAREAGCRSIGLRSNVIRDQAHEFYLRYGYRHIKTQKSFRKEL